MQLPARLGKYELVEFLGGGMSHVFRAKDTVIGRTVAVKILTPEGCADSETKERFLQEARMAGNINHDNIINIYDFGEDQGRPFLVMEFLHGQDLRTLIKTGQTGDLKNKLTLALQAAHAIEYVHSQNIVHRDIKPDNLQVTSKGIVKLMDFGIAKVEDLSRTRPGFVLGTPYYMAPEQVRGEKITALVDVYAFGVVLFELISGVKPFKADTVEQIFRCILYEPVDMTPVKQANVPQTVCQLITRCTAKDPAQRPQSFAEICRDLDRAIGELDLPGEHATRQVAIVKPRPKWIIPAAIFALLLLGTAIYFAIPGRPKPLPKTVPTPTGEMILIPAGQFLSGANKQAVPLPDYYIDKTEVTNADYAKYFQERGRQLPKEFPSAQPNLPVTNITIEDAKDFAKWAGKRLPNMLEWEKAARGTDGRPFPWGGDADANRANLRSAAGSQDRPWPVDQFGQDQSPFGILNLAGNVAELVDQVRPPSAAALHYFAKLTPPARADEIWYVVRGGSYHQPLSDGIIYDFGTIPARVRLPEVGFRCAMDPPPSK